jgi:hypothetical protein
LHHGIELGPVAGGEGDCFVDGRVRAEGPEYGADASAIEGCLLSILDRRRLV